MCINKYEILLNNDNFLLRKTGKSPFNDGDQVSAKLMFTQEANAEAEEIMKSLKHFVTVKGNLIRVVENEAFLTFYNMTRD